MLKILQNAKFDMLVLTRAGFPLPAPIDDTMLISYSMEAGLHGHGMDELSVLHLGHTPISFDEVTGTGRNRVTFAQVPIERATPYAAEDADVTLRLWQILHPRLRAAHALALYEQVERRLVPVLLEMERAGVKVDEADLRRMSIDFEQRMAVMETNIHRLAGHPFNVGSAKQLGEVLFDEMAIKGGKRMTTGAWGTDASTDPNLQNIPVRTEEGSRIRRAFIAEPGHVLVSADYSQIELRLLAHVADIPQLKESFLNGEDIHARTASEVFGIPMAGMDPMTRRRAKAINFGIIYGISAFGLARQLGVGPGEAKTYIDAYFTRYPAIRTYMDRTKAEARENGYVTSPFGRRCWIPGIADKNPARRSYGERQAINAPLQGGAADIIKRAMVKLPAALHEAGLKSRLLLQVHDELLFEAPEAEAAPLAALVKKIMEAAASLSVPLVVETGTGKNWAEAH